jgi:glycerophosphoryl diester phosphodiesterase
MRVSDRTYAGERIPTLEQVFQLFETTNHLLYLEMKSDASQRSELARAVCESIQTSKFKDRVVVECFDHAAIEIVKQINSDIKTAALFEPGLKNPPLVSLGRKLANKARAVGADEIALHHRLATQRTIDTATKAGLKVVVWTVDTSEWIERARNNDIKGLITNDPGMMVQERDASTSD